MLTASGAVVVAGCNTGGGNTETGQDDGSTLKNEDTPDSTDEPGTESESPDLEAVESDVPCGSSPDRLINVGGGLLATWTDNQEEVEGISYRGEILGGYHNFHDPFFPVDAGVSYRVNEVIGESNGTKEIEWVLMSGGNELYRWTPGPDSQLRHIQPEGAADGKLLWINKLEDTQILMHGDEPLSTEYDEYRSVTTIGDEIAYIGLEKRNDFLTVDSIVLGGEVIEDNEDTDGFPSRIIDISGDLCIVRHLSDGAVTELNGQQVGREYTARNSRNFTISSLTESSALSPMFRKSSGMTQRKMNKSCGTTELKSLDAERSGHRPLTPGLN